MRNWLLIGWIRVYEFDRISLLTFRGHKTGGSRISPDCDAVRILMFSFSFSFFRWIRDPL